MLLEHAHHIRKFFGRSNSQNSVTSASFTVGGFQLEGYAMTLSAFAWNIARTYTLTPERRYSFGCRYRWRAWTSWCRRAESPSCTSGAFGGSPPGWWQSAGTLDLYSMQIRGRTCWPTRGPRGLATRALVKRHLTSISEPCNANHWKPKAEVHAYFAGKNTKPLT